MNRAVHCSTGSRLMSGVGAWARAEPGSGAGCRRRRGERRAATVSPSARSRTAVAATIIGKYGGLRTERKNPPARIRALPHVATGSVATHDEKTPAQAFTQSRLERLNRWTAAEQVPVAVDVVDARDRGPELVLARPGSRERRLIAGVRPAPFVGRDGARGVGCALEDVVLAVGPAVFHGTDPLADGDACVAVAVQLALRLALGGLDHQGAGHGIRHRRRVEAVIHEPILDVL